jgi:hypothetical protein
MPVMICAGALWNGTAIRAWDAASGLETFVWASLLVMMTDITAVFREMFTYWHVLFVVRID